MEGMNKKPHKFVSLIINASKGIAVTVMGAQIPVCEYCGIAAGCVDGIGFYQSEEKIKEIAQGCKLNTNT